MKRAKAVTWMKAMGVTPPLSQPRPGWLVSHCPLGPWVHEQGKSSPEVFGIKVDIGDEGDAFCNCLAEETRVVTWDAVREIGELAGQDHLVLTTGGEWVHASFKSYGVQQLWKITMSLNGVTRVEYATAGHRWFVRGGSERTTEQLLPGHRLEAVLPSRKVPSPSLDGIRHGLVYGDGCVQKGKYAEIKLYGESRKLSWLFSDFSVTDKDDHTYVYVGEAGRWWKRHPFGFGESRPSDEYLAGFVAGWLAADGHVTKEGDVMLASAKYHDLTWLRHTCLKLGLALHPTKVQVRTGLGKEPTPLYSACFVRSLLPHDFMLRGDMIARFKPGSYDRLRWTVLAVEPSSRVEEVYCAEVPGTASFALENNLLTGNCFSCGWHGQQSDLVIEMQMRERKQSSGIARDFKKALQLIVEAEDEDVFDFDTPDIEQEVLGGRQRLHEFPEWWLATFAEWRSKQWAIDYLESRSIGPKVADRMDIRVDTTQRRVCWPVRDFNGTLRGLHGRAITADVEPRYRMYLQAGKNNPIVWLGEHLVDMEKPIVVVEGPVDMASVMRVYRNVVSPLFVNPSHDKLRRMSDCLEWFSLFDQGKGGKAGREKLDTMKGPIVRHLYLPETVKDPGECDLQTISDIIGEWLPLDGTIS